jgi:hypothetical protein
MNPVRQMRGSLNGRIGEGVETLRHRAAEIPRHMTECVEEHPTTSVLAAFGVGLIAGVGLVALYCQTQRQPETYESLVQRVTDTLRNSLSQPLSVFRS